MSGKLRSTKNSAENVDLKWINQQKRIKMWICGKKVNLNACFINNLNPCNIKR